MLLARAVVNVLVIYCGGCGYRPKYEQLKNELETTFRSKVPVIPINYSAPPDINGLFEVEVNEVLIHSKKRGDGYVDTPAKLQKIKDAISGQLRLRAMDEVTASESRASANVQPEHMMQEVHPQHMVQEQGDAAEKRDEELLLELTRLLGGE